MDKQSIDGLGAELPFTEDELFHLEKFPIFDMKSLKDIYGDTANFDEELQKLLPVFLSVLIEDLSLIQLKNAKNDWSQVEFLAHKMKGSCLYSGAQKLAVSCQYLERYLKNGHDRQKDQLVKQLIEVAEETRSVIKTWLQRPHENLLR